MASARDCLKWYFLEGKDEGKSIEIPYIQDDFSVFSSVQDKSIDKISIF